MAHTRVNDIRMSQSLGDTTPAESTYVQNCNVEDVAAWGRGVPKVKCANKAQSLTTELITAKYLRLVHFT